MHVNTTRRLARDCACLYCLPARRLQLYKEVEIGTDELKTILSARQDVTVRTSLETMAPEIKFTKVYMFISMILSKLLIFC